MSQMAEVIIRTVRTPEFKQKIVNLFLQAKEQMHSTLDRRPSI